MNTAVWAPFRQYTEEHADKMWFCDRIHWPLPVSPMNASHPGIDWGMIHGAEYLSLPVTKGMYSLVYKGWLYLSPIPVTDEAELKEREARWNEIFPAIMSKFDQFYAEAIEKLEKNNQDLDRVLSEIPGLPLNKLVDAWDEMRRFSERKEEIHLPMMYLANICYMIFEGACRAYDIPEKDMVAFLSGTKNKMTEADEGLWKLTRRAKEIGLADLFLKEEHMEELPAKLSKIPEGEEWFKEFNVFLKRYGHKQESGATDYNQRTWFEYPAPALFTIKTYLMMPKEVSVDEVLAEQIRTREALTQSTLAKMKTEQEKEEFLAALKNAQASYPWNEDHNMYCDQGGFARVRYIMLAVGKRLIELGILEQPDDIFFLTIDEVRGALRDLSANEHVGVMTYRLFFPAVVRNRRDMHEEFRKAEPPPMFIGKAPEKVLDPLFIKVWGLTAEAVSGEISLEPTQRLEGFPASPGVVEGIARVCLDVETAFTEIMPGDIVIAPSTNSSWTALFSKVKAVVTDAGGMLTHTAICARDYGIPAVVGTWKASKMIKTGQRIRVDGTRGVVEILE